MKKFLFSQLASTSAIATLLLFTGCEKQTAHTADDGHGHGASEHGEAKSHTETKNGITMCTEHNVAEAKCAVCKPELATTMAPGDSLELRLPSLKSASIVGVRTAAAETGPIAEGLDCVAEISFNQNAVAQIAAPATGIVQSVEVDLGSKVRGKQVVARLSSPAVSEAVSKAILSHQILERERRLRQDRVTSQQSLQEAEAAHRAACQQARAFSFSEEQIEALAKQPSDQVQVEVRAPFDGEIIERSAVTGSLVEAGRPLFTIANPNEVWAMLQVPETTLHQIRTGQPVELRVDSLPGRVFTGRLTWISPAVDERSRMTRARAEFSNTEGLLRDRMFASARILIRTEKNAVLVPPTAIQHVEGKPFVFVKREEDLYDARRVQLGTLTDGRQEVLSGLRSEEQVAVSHVFAIKSAMLMSHLGAGCADD